MGEDRAVQAGFLFDVLAGFIGCSFGRAGDVRGLGAMVAMELVTDRASNNPDAALTNAVIAEAEARGLIILPCGTRGNVVRLLPPLTTPMDQVTEALDIIEAALEAAVNSLASA